MTTIVFKEESFKITGACFEVYKEKGAGFLEAVFQECLAMEFEVAGIPFAEKPWLNLSYKGRLLKSTYQPDFVCYGKIIVEIKAISALTDETRAQIINYLKASGLPLGILVNFGHYPKIEIERFVNRPGGRLAMNGD
ncbi:MAG TPA: GxxExxY protein [Kiritimatiellia bacterium]|nr:GxxExxY protein [Kiritimatiellia bacterium]HMP34388.1 GxxExxY protein [Kiritimatiellia bacterium]